MKHFEIICPCCNTILIIDRLEEKVIEERRPIIEQTTGDRFKDAVIKSKQQKVEVEKKFKESAEAQKNKRQSLQDIFKKSLKKVKESGDTSKPKTPFDFD